MNLQPIAVRMKLLIHRYITANQRELSYLHMQLLYQLVYLLNLQCLDILVLLEHLQDLDFLGHPDTHDCFPFCWIAPGKRRILRSGEPCANKIDICRRVV